MYSLHMNTYIYTHTPFKDAECLKFDGYEGGACKIDTFINTYTYTPTYTYIYASTHTSLKHAYIYIHIHTRERQRVSQIL